MNLEIWAYVFGGATVFGLIVGIFSVFNGRRTRKSLKEAIQTIGLKLDEGFRKMDEGFRRIDRGLELIAKLIVEENEKTRKEILEALGK